MGLEGPAWVAFQVSPSPHAAVPPPFSAAPAVQPKAAFGLWRRWHGKAEVPLLLQHHPVEQVGGLDRLSFPWGAGHTATDPGTCDPRWHEQVCLQGEVLPQGGLHMRFCSLSCSSVSACVCWHLREEGVVWARLSSPLGPPWWERERRCPPLGRGHAHLLRRPLLSLAPCSQTPSLGFLSLLLPQ